jgi:hypothetical protein
MVELTWEGKYDEKGRRTAPLRLQLPFQTVETVNESAQKGVSCISWVSCLFVGFVFQSLPLFRSQPASRDGFRWARVSERALGIR